MCRTEAVRCVILQYMHNDAEPTKALYASTLEASRLFSRDNLCTSWILLYSQEMEDDDDDLEVDDDDLEDFAKFRSATPVDGSGPSGAGGDGENASAEDAAEDEDDLLGA